MKEKYVPLEKFGIESLEQFNISPLSDIKEIPNCGGIYMFTIGWMPIYIGRSQGVRCRIEAHMRTGRLRNYKNKLNKISILWLRNTTRDVYKIETILIRYFKPKLNVQLIR